MNRRPSTIGLSCILSPVWRDGASGKDAGGSLLTFPKTSEQAQAELGELLCRSPQLSGLSRSRWWLDGLAQVVVWLKGRTLSGIWQMLHRLGLKYKRGREYIHSPDPDYDLKMTYIQAAERLARTEPERYVLLYGDEVTYYRRPSLARAYARKGSKMPLAYQGHTTNKRRRIAGALDAIRGTVLAQQRSSFNRRRLIVYYHEIAAAYPHAETIFLVQDNWPVHFHPDILQVLPASRICLLRLPTYAPWTNPIEKLWLRLKQELIHQHHFQDDWNGLQQAVQDWLDHCDDDPLDLLRYVGLFPC